ncbi:MAG TPA: hypothetical protein VH518_21555 [Tepidisphaeraceae bacterium]
MSAAADFASADVLFSNRGGGTEGTDVFSSQLNAPTLEDGVFAAPLGPQSITGINIGYDNTGVTPVSMDVLVSFWDTVNYDVVPATSSIVSGQVGPTYRFSVMAAPGANETGLMSLTGGPLLFPDNSFGVVVNFVAPAGNTPLLAINHLFKDVPVATGSSDGLFAFDQDLSGVIDGNEVFTWQDGPFPDANMYLEIQGSAVPVPEPAAAGLAALAGASLLRRRRERI